MRELKFRAWDKDVTKMFPVHTLGLEGGSTFTHGVSDEYSLCKNGCRNLLNFELMQFIGYFDRNGKEIWEGDIVLTDEVGWVAEVVYDYGMFRCVDKDGGFSSLCNWSMFEVIGNIYENPELLKGDES